MPKRIQRKRIRGWKMPPNTVSVCRPGKFGNPYIVGNDGTPAECVIKFRRYIDVFLDNAAFAELRGKNLACWCKLGQPCHADVLLEVSNVQIEGQPASGLSRSNAGLGSAKGEK